MKVASRITNYIVKVFNGMALGLFSSLIIGLILKQLGILFNLDALIKMGTIAQNLMGPAIGAGVAYSIGVSPLGIFASLITGAIGAGTITILPIGTLTMQVGEPVGALVASLAGAEFSRLIQGKTKVDIVLVPAGTILLGGLVGTWIGPVVVLFMTWFGNLINRATELHPFPMGILVSTLMGLALTAPISSAALAISLGLEGLAAGAATVGCSAQMIGFAVASYRENKMGGLIAQGIGTSMLQIPNIVKNPLIWLPPTIASAILGPISTVVFKMRNNPIGAGMGTSGLVGQIATIEVMGTKAIFPIILLHFLLPAVITYFIAEYMRKKGYIKEGDMLLSE
ncbi:MAG TPA: PTS sugar transporter subunit IIC [Halanaerobiaceae bacterium]|nr:PTS sugar transporter subunit IIC [Bacillota bacterium]HHU91722.1 PTS sugar transporter subunit IIC [Halanaerobiaceae bacterium]HOA40396.1 PTS sugar transporter subunit IIC [Halanaerobiales bacterium]HPZ62542.1 PTS sugar transporter subunit IIC [Halanaerobiales bacterium]HQD03162.1 PTS sugar transporter subunit IIC [Halanaerobiales bacterium]